MYKGPISSAARTRDFKCWILVFSDGEEICLQRKQYAVMFAKHQLNTGNYIRIFEETVIRTIKNGTVVDDTFRIDITNSIRLELLVEQ